MKILIFPILFILILSCNNSKQIFPSEPSIEFISALPDTVKEFQTFNIKLRYKDGDGDLGSETADTSNYDLFLLDQRPNLPTFYDGIIKYNLPYLTTDTRKPSIQGVIDITVSGIVRIDPFIPKEEVSFKIYLQDRAGNKSNIVTTNKITIIP